MPPLPAGSGFVKTQRLRKVFPRGVAVHGLDLEMRSGSISALLGANGAGKTTTISMLTGLIPPTAGDGFINGLSIKTDMRAIRASIGVCPQANVLFDSMTPRLHLRLYAALKGLGGKDMDDAVEAILADVGLTERGDTVTENALGHQRTALVDALGRSTGSIDANGVTTTIVLSGINSSRRCQRRASLSASRALVKSSRNKT